MPLNLNGYPFDNTAEAATNRINPEVIAITDAGSRLFVPSAGFFFGKNFRIVDQLGVALQPGTEFKLLNLEKDATIATGRDVYSVVQVIKASATQVTLDYQCVGGTYSDTANSIRQLLASLPANSLNAVYWGQILNRPVQFPPAAHMHHAADWYGLGEVVTLLDEIRQAILVGDTAQFQAVYQYIAEMFDSGLADFLRDNIATLQEVYDGLDDVKFCTPAKLRYAINSTFASSVPEQDQIDIDTTNVFFVQKQLTFVPGGQPETALIHTYTFPNLDEQTFSASVPRAQVAFTSSGQNVYSRRHNGGSNNWSAWVPLVQSDTLVSHDPQTSYLTGNGQPNDPLAVDINKVYQDAPGVAHDPVTSYLLGTGKVAEPLSVDTDRLSNQFAQLRNLPISQVGDPNDSFLPASSGYFSITAPRAGRRNSGTMYLEANGDILGLTPTTNGEVIRMVYFRVKGFSEGLNESAATDRVYKPAFLTGTESVQSCFPTSENAMVVEIWDVDGIPGDGEGEGRERFKEHAIVLLNETLVDTFHANAFRLGHLLVNEYKDTTETPYATAPNTSSADYVDVAGGTPVAIINRGIMHLFLAKNDIEVVSWTSGLTPALTGVNNSNGSTFARHTYWQVIERRINPATNAVTLVNDGTARRNIRPYADLRGFGNGVRSLFQINDPDIVLVPWKGSTDERTGSMLNVARTRDGYLTLSITHHARVQWTNNSAVFIRSVMATTTLQVDVANLVVYHNRFISGGTYPPNSIVLTPSGTDLFAFIQPEQKPVAPGINAISIRGWLQLLGDGTIAYGPIQSDDTGTQAMNILRRTPMPMRFDRAYNSLFYSFYPYVTTLSVPVKLYLEAPTPYRPRSISRFINNNWLLAIPELNTQSGISTTREKNVYRPEGSLSSRQYDTPEYGLIDGYNISTDRHSVGEIVAPATLGSWSGGTATHNNLSFWKEGGIVAGVDDPSKDQVRYQAFNVLPDVTGQVRIFESSPIYLGNQVNLWITESLYPNHDGGSDDLEWNLYIPPLDTTRGVLIVATLNNGFASTSHYAVKIEYSGSIIVGLNGAVLGIQQSIPFVSTFDGVVLAASSGLNIDSASRFQHIGTVITFEENGSHWWAIRSGFVVNMATGSQVDTAYRIYEQVEDPDVPGSFDLLLNATIAVGVSTTYATVQSDLGAGLMDSGAGYGALTVFRKISRTGYDGNVYVVATPRPAEGFYINVTEPIPVLLSGVIRYIDPGQYDLSEQITNPANKTIYVYATLAQGTAFLEFLETPTIEINFRTYLGQLTTDLTGITAGTLSPVSRFLTYRASATERGSSFAVSGGRPDQTTGINLGWT